MRLICPNCEAQYEVDDGAIPEGGRDVQCSSCGHAWFKLPPQAEGAQPGAPDGARTPHGNAVRGADAPAGAPDNSELPGDTVQDQAAMRSGAARRDEPDESGEADASEGAAPDAQLLRPKLDDSVLSVLREEAERESRARRADAARIETQPDLGLSGQVPRPPTATADNPEPPADTREPDPPADAREDEEWPPAPRKRLPDIEEINSTLKPSGAAAADAPEEAAAIADAQRQTRRRRGFRIGFLVVFLAVLGGLGVYAFAPQIVALVPDVEPAMTEYVRMIDEWRLAFDARLDAAMRALTEAISGDEA